MTEEKETTSKSPGGIKRDKKCPVCSRIFGMSWALENHKKLCIEKEKAIKENPQRYCGKLKI